MGNTCDAFCARHTSLGVLHAVTFGFASVVLFRILTIERRVNYRFFIFALVWLHTLLGWVHYLVAIHETVLVYIMYNAQLVMYTLICYYFMSLACVLFRREKWVSLFVRPGFTILGLFVTGMTIGYAVHSIEGPRGMRCKDPFWLVMSVGGFFLTALFFVSAVFITRKLEYYMVVSRSLREERTKVLRWLLGINAFSTFVACVYDVVIAADAYINSRGKCDQDWTSSDFWNVFFYAILRSIIQLLPDWSALFVLYFLQHWRRHGRGRAGPVAADGVSAGMLSPGQVSDEPSNSGLVYGHHDQGPLLQSQTPYQQ